MEVVGIISIVIFIYCIYGYLKADELEKTLEENSSHNDSDDGGILYTHGMVRNKKTKGVKSDRRPSDTIIDTIF